MKYFIKKFCTLIITLFIVSLLAFLAFQVIPGDPTTALLGTEATAEAREALRQELGLDQPVLLRYFDWLCNFLHGDMGTSYNYRMPVADMLSDKLPITAILTLMSFAFTVVLSIPLGIWAGSTKSRALDLGVTVLDQIIMSVPQFFLGMLACYVFGNLFRLFVPGNFVSYTVSWGACLGYMVLPAPLMAAFQQRLGFYSCTVPSFEQYTLARFLSRGHFEKHLNRMRKVYKSRRNALVSLVEGCPIAHRLTILEQDAGLHFLLQVDTQLSDAALTQGLAAAGVRVKALSGYYHDGAADLRCLVINYSGLQEDAFRKTLEVLQNLLENQA